MEKSEKIEMARHYNSLMWNLIYIGFGLTLWILFTIYSNDKIDMVFKLILCLFGFYTFGYFSVIIEKSNWRKWKNLKDEPEPKFPLFFKNYTSIEGMFILRVLKIMIVSIYLITAISFSKYFYNQDIFLFDISVLVVFFAMMLLISFEIPLLFKEIKL